MNKFRLHWIDGSVEIGEGDSPAETFKNLGYGGGAVKALDYFEDVTPVSIKVGDKITFRKGWKRFDGVVRTAVNYPHHNNPQDIMLDDWYIELVEEEEGYMYIKQVVDSIKDLKVRV